MTWYHHATLTGVLGVAALYLVSWVFSGELLYYGGPGDPLWLDEILAGWHVVSGGLLGVGLVFWAKEKL